MTPSTPDLSGVPETMLWTLHNRASEARRADAILQDPRAVALYTSIDHDYERSFGRPDGSHALRSRLFDDAVGPWMASHPGGTVVELGCGLETQFHRLDDGKVSWVCVDVPEAMAVRDRLLPPSDRCRHVARSALDLGWMDEVPARAPLFVTAQGLFMYFREPDVRRLIVAILERFPGVELMFDAIPPWFSRKTLRGYARTKHYRAPPMPWGLSASQVERTLRAWSPRIERVETIPFGPTRGFGGAIMPLFARVPALRDLAPTAVRVSVGGSP